MLQESLRCRSVKLLYVLGLPLEEKTCMNIFRNDIFLFSTLVTDMEQLLNKCDILSSECS